jgi:quinolinate synthase
VKRAAERAFIIGTEMGILYRLRTENPDKAFYPVNDRLLCPNMKKISLEKVLWSLEDLQHCVTVDAAISARARRSIEAMLKLE